MAEKRQADSKEPKTAGTRVTDEDLHGLRDCYTEELRLWAEATDDWRGLAITDRLTGCKAEFERRHARVREFWAMYQDAQTRYLAQGQARLATWTVIVLVVQAAFFAGQLWVGYSLVGPAQRQAAAAEQRAKAAEPPAPCTGAK